MSITLQEALRSQNVGAFLSMLRYGEGTADALGYHRLFGGKNCDSLEDHPRDPQTCTLRGGKTLTSTAAGAYQFLARTWDGLVREYGFADFSPQSQDLGAVALIKGRGALDDVIAGRLGAAIIKCNKEWASLPGSPYGQPTVTMDKARQLYMAAGGSIMEIGGKPVAPFLLAALPSLLEAAPRLMSLFGSGSEVSARNEKAIQTVVDIAKAAIGAPNEQALAESVASDAGAAKAVREAVEAHWFAITDATGVEAAQRADAVFVASGEPVWHSPSFLIACALLPLVYLLVLAVVGVIGQPFSDDVRSAIANGVIGLVLGGLIGYYYGQTTSRNRTPGDAPTP